MLGSPFCQGVVPLSAAISHASSGNLLQLHLHISPQRSRMAGSLLPAPHSRFDWLGITILACHRHSRHLTFHCCCRCRRCQLLPLSAAFLPPLQWERCWLDLVITASSAQRLPSSALNVRRLPNVRRRHFLTSLLILPSFLSLSSSPPQTKTTIPQEMERERKGVERECVAV